MAMFKSIIYMSPIVIVIFSVCLCIEGFEDRRNLHESDVLKLLLKEREERLQNFDLMGSDRMTIDFFRLTTAILSNKKKNVYVSERVIERHWLLKLGHKFFANKSLDYRREGYQLIRDLYIEAVTNSEKIKKCLIHLLHNSNKEHPSTFKLLHAVQNIGFCFDLRYKDYLGKEMFIDWQQLEYNKRDNNDLVIKFGMFLDSKNQAVSRATEVKHVLNALLILLSNIDKSEEFIGGKTQWYGGVSEDNSKKWQSLVYYVCVCRQAKSLPIAESDDMEKVMLTSERQLRVATFPYEKVPKNVTKTLQVINSNLESLLSGTDDPYAHGLLRTFLPSVNQDQALQFTLEMYQLYRDLMMEVELARSEKIPKFAKDQCTRYFAQRYLENSVYIDNSFAYDPVRSQKFPDNVFIINAFNARHILNLTYVDYNANIIEYVNGSIRGKYVYNSKLPECPLTRRLRHIFNGFERFYFKIMETENFAPLEKAPDGHYLHCKYYCPLEFFEKDVPRYLLEAEQTHILNIATSSKLPPYYYNFLKLINFIKENKKSFIDLPIEVLNAYPLFKEAHEFLYNWPISLRYDAYKCIMFLQMEQWFSEHSEIIVTDLFDTKTASGDTCNISHECPGKLLRLLQLVGRQFELKYVNEFGEEILINDALFGRFIYIPITKDEPGATRRVKHNLNSFLSLVKAYRNLKVQAVKGRYK